MSTSLPQRRKKKKRARCLDKPVGQKTMKRGQYWMPALLCREKQCLRQERYEDHPRGKGKRARGSPLAPGGQNLKISKKKYSNGKRFPDDARRIEDAEGGQWGPGGVGYSSSYRGPPRCVGTTGGKKNFFLLKKKVL